MSQWVIWDDSPYESDYNLIVEWNDAYIETWSHKTKVTDILSKKAKWERTDYRYNQRDRSRGGNASCTLDGALISICNMLGIELTEQQKEDAMDFAAARWYRIGFWSYTPTRHRDMVDFMQNLTWIELMYLKFSRVKDWRLTEEARYALRHNLLLRMSHVTFVEMFRDRLDWVLNWSDFTTRVGAHSTNICMRWDDVYVIGSWFREEYSLEKREQHIIDLVGNWTIRNYSFVTVRKADIPKDMESHNALETMILHGITRLTSEEYKAWRDRSVTRREIALMLYRMMKIMSDQSVVDWKTKLERIREEIDKLEKK